MYITVRGERYKVHIRAPNPFAISHGRVIGITPDAPESMLPEFRAAWREECDKGKEANEWAVNTGNREHQVLRFGDRFVCDCWPFKRTGDCKHIEAVREECL